MAGPFHRDDAWVERLLRYRKEKDQAFKRAPESPIPRAERPGFTGLAYFEVDPRYRFELVPEAPSDSTPVPMETSDGATRSYLPVARLRFRAPDGEGTLTAYEQGDDWFVPFRDTTSAKETYGAGRYLEIHAPGPTVVLDFNTAYNPFCAYSDAYSCPFPPPENWLSIPIRAGEKVYARG